MAQRMGRSIAIHFHVALEGGGWSAARPGCTLPLGKTWYPFYRRLGGPQGQYGQAENLIPTRIRSRTVQPIVSRYTNWATRPNNYDLYKVKLLLLRLVVETCSHAALYVQVSSAYLSPKWIGSLCLCCVVYSSQQDNEKIISKVSTKLNEQWDLTFSQ